jgi:hypothetical protein
MRKEAVLTEDKVARAICNADRPQPLLPDGWDAWDLLNDWAKEDPLEGLTVEHYRKRARAALAATPPKAATT